MEITVLFFATLRDHIGSRRLVLEISDADDTVARLRRELMRRYPAAADHLKIALAAVNEEFAFDRDAIRPGDEVAFFPPVSGGSGKPQILLLLETPIDHDAVIAKITTPKTGALCLFSGMVRGQTEQASHIPHTEYLEYEAYQPMALAKMQQVAQEIRARWDKVEGIAIIQRIGRLAVGQNTVLIACSAPHRGDGCFEAARYGIDRLKEIVPIWKKEIGTDGAAWVEGSYQPQPGDRQNP